jgi:prepilin-type N-terminal cleavage/methylation domain-containing protein
MNLHFPNPINARRAQSTAPKATMRAARRGVTLIEMLVVMSIIILLLSAVLLAFGPAIRYVRAESERQTLRTIAQALENYKQVNGFLPPLVQDGPDPNRTPGNAPIVDPPGPAAPQPNIKGADLVAPPGGQGGTGGFLRYEASADSAGSDNVTLQASTYVTRSSIYSLPIYLLGSADQTVDGVAGYGSNNVDASGRFLLGVGNNKPMLDTAKFAERLQRRTRENAVTQNVDRFVILDRWGTPIRYYRWLPTVHQANNPGSPVVWRFPDGSAVPANNTSLVRETRTPNTPWPLGDPKDVTNALLRGASAAVVSAGPDRQIDDGVPFDQGVNADNIVELVQ